MFTHARLLLVLCLLVLCGFSAQAATSYSVKLGEYGLSTASEAVRFLTGDGNLWESRGVRIYSPNNKQYRKTGWRMRHLPKGSTITINTFLIPTHILSFDAPRTVESVCNSISVWKCNDRLNFFNADNTAKETSMAVPQFFPTIPNPKPLQLQPLPKTEPILIIPEWWERQLYWNLLFLILLLIVTGLLISLLLRQQPVQELSEIPRRSTGTSRRPMRRTRYQNLRAWVRDKEDRLRRVNTSRKTVISEDAGSGAVHTNDTVVQEQEFVSSPQSPLDLSNIPMPEPPLQSETPKESESQEVPSEPGPLEKVGEPVTERQSTETFFHSESVLTPEPKTPAPPPCGQETPAPASNISPPIPPVASQFQEPITETSVPESKPKPPLPDNPVPEEDPKSRTRRIVPFCSRMSKQDKLSLFRDILDKHGVTIISIEDALWPKVEIRVPVDQRQKMKEALQSARAKLLTEEEFSITSASREDVWHMVRFREP